MNNDRPFQSLQITVQPSIETNDHQVRFLIDGDDFIARHWPSMIGLDPDDILTEPSQLRASSTPTTITVARCSCGIVGCDRRVAEILCMPDNVVWRFQSDTSSIVHHTYQFDLEMYNSEIERAQYDTLWETPDRTAARLLATTLSHETLAANGFTYMWASGRVRDHAFTVSLSLRPGPYQILVHIPWQLESPSQIATKAAHILNEEPRTWTNVQWHPQAQGLLKPSIAGPKW